MSQFNGKPSTPGPAPASLRQLVRQIEDADEHKIAPDLVRTANALIEAAWNGSLCVKIIRRTIPLVDAIQQSTSALDAASIAYISTVPVQIRAVVGDAFDVAGFTQDNLKSFKHLKNLDFTGLGTVHYEHIQAALTTDEEAWKGGPFNDEMFIIQQFCQRIVDLLESLKERTGHRIANDVTAVSNADAPPPTSTDAPSMPVGVMPCVPRIYNAAAGRIYGGKNWPACTNGPFDWTRLFGPKADDDDESGPWLTPRMAARLHHIAIVDGEQLLEYDNWPPY